MSAVADKVADEFVDFLKGPGRLLRFTLGLVGALALTGEADGVSRLFKSHLTLEDAWDILAAAISELPLVISGVVFALVLFVFPFINRLVLHRQMLFQMRFVKPSLERLSAIGDMSKERLVEIYGEDLSQLREVRDLGKKRVSLLVSASEVFLVVLSLAVAIVVEIAGPRAVWMAAFFFPAWALTAYLIAATGLILMLREVSPYRIVTARLMMLARTELADPRRAI